MEIGNFWKYLAAWFVMLVVSVANGVVRDLAYGKRLGELAAHQLSTAIGMSLLGLVMWLFLRWYPPASGQQALAIGLFWLALTVAFEFLFFHFVGGHPWSALLTDYNLLQGRVWVILLVWIAVAPYLFFRLR